NRSSVRTDTAAAPAAKYDAASSGASAPRARSPLAGDLRLTSAMSWRPGRRSALQNPFGDGASAAAVFTTSRGRAACPSSTSWSLWAWMSSRIVMAAPISRPSARRLGLQSLGHFFYLLELLQRRSVFNRFASGRDALLQALDPISGQHRRGGVQLEHVSI